jgi:hypothetical protein
VREALGPHIRCRRLQSGSIAEAHRAKGLVAGEDEVPRSRSRRVRLFDALADALTDGIAAVPRRACVNRRTSAAGAYAHKIARQA